MFDKVFSKMKKAELMNILNNSHPSHPERLYFVGFLKWVGYAEVEIQEFIKIWNQWEDYDEGYTKFQIKSVFESLGGGQQKESSHKHSLLPLKTIEHLNEYFLRQASETRLHTFMNYDGWKEADKNKNAALGYYSQGYHVVPKRKDEKFPSIDWKPYIEKCPTPDEIRVWDWTYGVCLLATNNKCFLDIDLPHEKYVRWFPDYHMEKTPSGGMHIFGIGNPQTINVKGIGEIKGKGSLIVAYPTKGYEVIK